MGREDRAEDDPLEDIDDGAGCTEIWERLSAYRRDGGDTAESNPDDATEE
ncbi:MAG: hypothetical protein ABEJ44_01915 [Halanaeroarchaeum sp.]